MAVLSLKPLQLSSVMSGQPFFLREFLKYDEGDI